MTERSVEHLAVNVPLDPYLPLKVLSKYSGLSVRKLRAYIADPLNPLPCYRPGGKLLVRQSDFDAWVARFRTLGCREITAVVDDVLTDLRS